MAFKFTSRNQHPSDENIVVCPCLAAKETKNLTIILGGHVTCYESGLPLPMGEEGLIDTKYGGGGWGEGTSRLHTVMIDYFGHMRNFPPCDGQSLFGHCDSILISFLEMNHSDRSQASI